MYRQDSRQYYIFYYYAYAGILDPTIDNCLPTVINERHGPSYT